MSVSSRVHCLPAFGLSDMAICGSALRKLAEEEADMEAFAKRATLYLYENLVDAKGQKACALVRFFMTQSAGDLPKNLQAMLPANVSDSAQCLVLLGTAGLKAEWRERTLSVHHQVIPLLDKHAVDQSPMISQLIKQFGLEVKSILQPDKALLIESDAQTYNVFHVADAQGNSIIPAQADFVIPYGIKSVLGFGGTTPSGRLFAMILFGTVPVASNTADLFRTIALNLRFAILRFDKKSVFSPEQLTDE